MAQSTTLSSNRKSLVKLTGLICLLTFLLIGRCYSQLSISGVLCDRQNNMPLAYVNIGVVDQVNGTVSDQYGKFIISNISNSDNLTFSSIGYHSLALTAASIKSGDTIFLNRAIYNTPEIAVTAIRFDSEEKILGLKNKSRSQSFGFGSAQLGTEIGALIEIKKPTFIKTANFVINHAKGDSLLLRLNIYNYKDGVIGDNILKENILIKEKQKKGTFTIDLEPYNIILDHHVLFALEWLRNFDEIGNKDITFDTKKSSKLKGAYFKLSSNSTFQQIPYRTNRKPCFYFTGVQTD